MLFCFKNCDVLILGIQGKCFALRQNSVHSKALSLSIIFGAHVIKIADRRAMMPLEHLPALLNRSEFTLLTNALDIKEKIL